MNGTDMETYRIVSELFDYLKQHTASELHALVEAAVDWQADDEYKEEEPPRTAGNVPIGWHKDDPVLKFCMTHIIPDGLKRNHILFKNLAIGLVYCGATENEISDIVERVIGNCPGKNLQELWGWIRKIRRDVDNGLDWEYNKAEMNIWIQRANEVLGNG